ncbi:MAG: hypothetical protein IPO92_11500 [Saprospiraceae bacterium]|nr:hypothetical protein [Saprospiraceae bacterium]
MTINALPTATINGAKEICTGGSSTFTASGGTIYKWSTNETTASIVVTTAATYTVTVTDAKGCSATANETLKINASPVATISGAQEVCFGGSSVFTAAGTGTYKWNTTATTASITVSTAGPYTVTVTDATGCEAVEQER